MSQFDSVAERRCCYGGALCNSRAAENALQKCRYEGSTLGKIIPSHDQGLLIIVKQLKIKSANFSFLAIPLSCLYAPLFIIQYNQ